MVALWKKWSAVVPGPFLATLLVAAGFMGFVTWEQSHWWSTKEDYSFGWLVPLFVIFVVYDRWQKIVPAIQTCATPGSPRAGGFAGKLLTLFGYLTLVGGMLLFLVGALYRAGAGPSYPGTLAVAMGTAAIVLAVIFVNAPAPEPASAITRSSIWSDARVRLASFFLFPSLVWLVSAPMVSVIESNLSLFMLNRVTTVVFFVFETLNMPIEQQGNTLILPTGTVGVAEACSGIRSLTACLFAGSFLSSVFLNSLGKKIALVGSAILFAFFTNLLRSLFLTAWAYSYGPSAIEGKVHDIAGYSVLGLTVVGLLCLLPLFNMKISFGNASDDSAEPPPSNPPPAKA